MSQTIEFVVVSLEDRHETTGLMTYRPFRWCFSVWHETLVDETKEIVQFSLTALLLLYKRQDVMPPDQVGNECPTSTSNEE